MEAAVTSTFSPSRPSPLPPGPEARRRRRHEMAANRMTLGGRALAVLVCSGAIAGFAVPVAAISLARHGRQQQTVRLLPAPPIPKTATQPALRYTGPVGSVTPTQPITITRLTRRQLERKTRALRTHIVPLPKIVASRHRSGSMETRLTPHTSTPPSKNGSSNPRHPTPVTTQGGAEAP
jgi:hypothetical protein